MISPEEYDAFVNLNNNEDLIIQKEDKGLLFYLTAHHM